MTIRRKHLDNFRLLHTAGMKNSKNHFQIKNELLQRLNLVRPRSFGQGWDKTNVFGSIHIYWKISHTGQCENLISTDNLSIRIVWTTNGKGYKSTSLWKINSIMTLWRIMNQGNFLFSIQYPWYVTTTRELRSWFISWVLKNRLGKNDIASIILFVFNPLAPLTIWIEKTKKWCRNNLFLIFFNHSVKIC